ncbi:hypothetical protein EJ110_NYTH06596 [Nymphaea thermarum]|nr:hypothetical protein EJ110_NYTH06596 [Nymphaea thermarum]
MEVSFQLETKSSDARPSFSYSDDEDDDGKDESIHSSSNNKSALVNVQGALLPPGNEETDNASNREKNPPYSKKLDVVVYQFRTGRSMVFFVALGGLHGLKQWVKKLKVLEIIDCRYVVWTCHDFSLMPSLVKLVIEYPWNFDQIPKPIWRNFEQIAKSIWGLGSSNT